MPPESPLPQRNGLSAAWVHTPARVRGVPDAWDSMAAWLRTRFPEHVDTREMVANGEFVYADGSVLTASDPYTPQVFVWFHRELREEPEVPGEISVVHRDERLVIVDKPPFLSSIPRGRHILQSVVVRMRVALDLPELTPAHRLDRVTSGLLALTTERQWRGAYQTLFQRQEVRKVYRAVAPIDRALALPTTVVNHIRKEHGAWQAEVIPHATPNARTLVELERDLGDGTGVYRLTPATGRTHQLRLHMHGLGLPLVGDPLYPEVAAVDVDDFSTPLQLLASELSFTDPVDGSERSFVSAREFPIPGPTHHGAATA